MQLQVVCDNDMKFTDVYCGWPGAVHDARVLRNSPLFHDAEWRTDDFFPGQTYQKSFNKFFNRHGVIVMKYGATLRAMRLAIQA